VQSALQLRFVPVTVITNAEGSNIVTELVVTQELASVQTTVNVPPLKPVAVGPVCPLLHTQLIGVVPPVVVTVAVPSDCPLQDTSVDVTVEENSGGSVILTVRVVEHPFASVTTTTAPGVKLVAVGVISPLFQL